MRDVSAETSENAMAPEASNQALLATAVDALDDAVLVVDNRNVIVAANVAAQRLFNSCSEDANQRPLSGTALYKLIPGIEDVADGPLATGGRRRLAARLDNIRGDKRCPAPLDITVAPAAGGQAVLTIAQWTASATYAAPESDPCFLQTLIDSIPAPVFYKGRDGGYLGCNRAFEEFLGKPRAQIIGQGVYGPSPSELAAIYKAADEALFAKGPGAQQVYETEVDTASKGRRRVVFSKANFTDGDGEVAGLIGVIFDITDRKRAEFALRQSEERFRLLMEHAADGYYLIRPDGAIIDVNSTACDALGYDRDTLLSMSIHDIDPSADPVSLSTCLDRMGENQVASWESLFHRRDGATFPVEVRLRRVDQGESAFALATVRDLSQQRRAEERLRTLSAAVEQSPSMIMITSADGTIEYVNPRFCAVAGWPCAEIAGSAVADLAKKGGAMSYSPAMIQAVIEQRPWSGLVHGLRPAGTARPSGGEAGGEANGGSPVWAYFEVAPIKDDAGKVTHMLIVAEHVTELIETERQLHQAQKMESLGNLAGGIAHDFNNLLQPILMLSQTTADSMEADDPRRTLLARVVEAAERARALVERILTFSRGAASGEQKTFALHEVVDEAVELLAASVADGVSVINRARPVGAVTGDPTELHAVIMNLGHNAADVLSGPGGTIEVALAVEAVDETLASRVRGLVAGRRYARLSVSDNGPGIPPGVRERIFDPFYTTKEVGRGTGLGLSIVQAVVTRHDGAMALASEPGQGTTFTIYLPLDGDAAAGSS